MANTTALLLMLVAGTQCQQSKWNEYYDKYSLEVLMVVLLVVLWINFVKGKSANARVLTDFMRSAMPFLADQFSYCGPDLADIEPFRSKAEAVRSVIDEETPFQFQLFLTGRINCKYALVTVVTKRRQDLLVSLFYSLLFPEKDRFFLEIALPQQAGPKGILYVIRTRQVRKRLEEFEDMRALCTRQNISALSGSNFTVYSENEDIANYLLAGSILETISAHGSALESVEISDCVQSEANRGVTIKLYGLLTPSSIETSSRSLLALGLKLADKYTEYVTPRRLVEKLQQNRTEFYAQKKKESSPQDVKIGPQQRWEDMTEQEKNKKREKEERRMKKKTGRAVVMKRI